METDPGENLDAERRLHIEMGELVRLVRSALAQGVPAEDLLNLVFDAIHMEGLDDPVAAAARAVIAEEISRHMESPDPTADDSD